MDFCQFRWIMWIYMVLYELCRFIWYDMLLHAITSYYMIICGICPCFVLSYCIVQGHPHNGHLFNYCLFKDDIMYHITSYDLLVIE